MRSLAYLVGLVAACSNEIDPQDVTTADLRGRWSSARDATSQRVLSFRDHGRFHPLLEGERDIVAIYDAAPLGQRIEATATYHVENGEIVNGEGVGALRVKILGFREDESLTIEAVDGTPLTYSHIDRCRIDPPAPVGWRNYGYAQATFVELPPNGYRNPVYVAFGADGEPVIGAGNMIFRYDGECVPEYANEGAVAQTLARSGERGTHIILDWNPAATVAGTMYYALLAPGELVYTKRALPVDWRYFVDLVDIDGAALMLFAQPGDVLTLVRDEGSSFSMTPVQGVPSGFRPTTLVASGAAISIVGTVDNGVVVLDGSSAGAFTATTVAPSGATPAAAGHDGDLWIVYDDGATSPQTRLDQLVLATRVGGAWTTEPFSIGAGPVVRYRDGRVHVMTGVEVEGHMYPMHTVIDGTRMTQEIIGERSGWDLPNLDIAHGLPGDLEVAADGSVLIGYNGFARMKRPGDAHTFGMANVTITITGSGRVTSTDGLVDCTQTCTIAAPVGRKLLLRATPAATFSSCPPLLGSQTMCDVFVGGYHDPFNPGANADVAVTATF